MDALTSAIFYPNQKDNKTGNDDEDQPSQGQCDLFQAKETGKDAAVEATTHTPQTTTSETEENAERTTTAPATRNKEATPTALSRVRCHLITSHFVLVLIQSK